MWAAHPPVRGTTAMFKHIDEGREYRVPLVVSDVWWLFYCVHGRPPPMRIREQCVRHFELFLNIPEGFVQLTQGNDEGCWAFVLLLPPPPLWAFHH